MPVELTKSVDWREHGAIVFNEGYEAAVAALYYQELAEEYSNQASDETNLQFWLGFYNLKE